MLGQIKSSNDGRIQQVEAFLWTEVFWVSVLSSECLDDKSSAFFYNEGTTHNPDGQLPSSGHRKKSGNQVVDDLWEKAIGDVFN